MRPLQGKITLTKHSHQYLPPPKSPALLTQWPWAVRANGLRIEWLGSWSWAPSQGLPLALSQGPERSQLVAAHRPGWADDFDLGPPATAGFV